MLRDILKDFKNNSETVLDKKKNNGYFVFQEGHMYQC